jgi:hypothetical protein
MPFKRILVFALVLLAMSAPIARAADTAGSSNYIEIADAPTITVDWSKGTTQSVTLGGNRTLQFVNGVKGGKYMLILKQDATGSRTVTWPSSVHWPGFSPQPSPAALTTTANKKDYLTFFFNGASYDAVGLTSSL